jgi:hypothetical protein
MLKIIFSAVVSLLALAANAQDTQTSAKWGEVGGWSIRVDRSVGDGCFASQAYTDGSYVRLGFDMKKSSIYFMISNDSWRSLEEGKLYPMQFVFDGQYKYNGELRGLKTGNNVWLDHSNVSGEFTKDFMQRSSLRIFYQGNRIAALSLANTYAAVAEVTNCQREIGGTKGGSQPAVDPFNSGSKRSLDPFSR